MSNINVVLPIYWTQTYKTKADKTVLMGMNWFRNAHYFAQNKAKKEFNKIAIAQLDDTIIQSNYRLVLKIYYKNSNCDGANIAAIMEKFILDTLQQKGTVVNDNVKYHLGSSWTVEGQDKENPRCEISIQEIKGDPCI